MIINLVKWIIVNFPYAITCYALLLTGAVINNDPALLTYRGQLLMGLWVGSWLGAMIFVATRATFDDLIKKRKGV